MPLRTFTMPTAFLAIAGCFCGGEMARADLVEETLQLPTDGAGTPMFPVNPSAFKPKNVRFGALGALVHRETVLDHAAVGGTKIDATVTDNDVGGGFGIDLGAGAGIGLEHVEQFHLVSTAVDNRGGAGLREASKNQQTSAKLIVELTTELRAAIVMRYLQQSAAILGEPFLDQREATRHKTSMIGYGCGLTYAVKDMGIGYTYYPPLQGKTDIAGQELIVIEPGFIAVDAFLQRGVFTFGLFGKHWLVQNDDLAVGSTAADNKTRISFYGLDPDQYIVRTQLIMLGIDYALNAGASVRLALGQEQAHFDFKNLLVYDGAGVNQNGQDVINTNRGRLSLHGAIRNFDGDLGYGIFSRSFKFSESEGSGSYKTIGQEMFATLGLRF